MYSECAFVASGVLHAMRMHHIFIFVHTGSKLLLRFV